MTVVNLRGTHGAGKSSAVTLVLERYARTTAEVRDAHGKTRGYLVNERLAVVGPYRTACGGCDAVKTQADVFALLRMFAAYPAVVFEGAVVSTIFSSYAAYAREIAPRPMHFVFLDTPFEQCLANVNRRRAERGVGELTNLRAITDKYHLMERLRTKFDAAGLSTFTMSRDQVFHYLDRLATEE